jgi:hypothetical protein
VLDFPQPQSRETACHPKSEGRGVLSQADRITGPALPPLTDT